MTPSVPNLPPDSPLWKPADTYQIEMQMLAYCFRNRKIFGMLLDRTGFDRKNFIHISTKAIASSLDQLWSKGLPFGEQDLKWALVRDWMSEPEAEAATGELAEHRIADLSRRQQKQLIKRALLHLSHRQDSLAMANYWDLYSNEDSDSEL